jgi:FMN phosphatase YigB (HAD superfamily)
MKTIKGILFEPVGCLAEFPAQPFLEIAATLSGRKRQTSKSGSRAYWHLLNLMEEPLPTEPRASASGLFELELEAVDRANLYDDVIPALAELKAMGIQQFIASSLSSAAITRFIERCTPIDFDGIWSRDNAGGIKSEPLRRALDAASLPPGEAMFLTDTAEGLKAAGSVGVNAVLMMNDPDESRRLATHNPAGGIVSLHELPDFIRFVGVENIRACHKTPGMFP